MDYHLLVCLLFTPGTKPEHFNTALEQKASGVILDLEDSVSVEDKDIARQNVIDFLKQNKTENFATIVRINSLKNFFGIKDIHSLVEQKIQFDAIMLPKTESPEEINLLANILSEQGMEQKIIGLIESSKAVTNLDRIVQNSCNHLVALAFGGADYALDLGAELDEKVTQLGRAKIIQTAGLKKIATYDQPTFDFNNMEKFQHEINDAKEMGFTGKLAIHPKQIATIIHSYAPTPDKVNEAEQIVTIYNNAKGKACQYKGKMIDIPVYKNAQRTLNLVQHLKKLMEK